MPQRCPLVPGVTSEHWATAIKEGDGGRCPEGKRGSVPVSFIPRHLTFFMTEVRVSHS
jgi:hypothetical protein